MIVYFSRYGANLSEASEILFQPSRRAQKSNTRAWNTTTWINKTEFIKYFVLTIIYIHTQEIDNFLIFIYDNNDDNDNLIFFQLQKNSLNFLMYY